MLKTDERFDYFRLEKYYLEVDLKRVSIKLEIIDATFRRLNLLQNIACLITM